mmetsp:Transcript_84605/g.274088  ORF Transcript_84605/g.274088 Transcript_84605/m.274088 type:complete len:219 (+) Transcript_84605:212-868(+)
MPTWCAAPLAPSSGRWHGRHARGSCPMQPPGSCAHPALRLAGVLTIAGRPRRRGCEAQLQPSQPPTPAWPPRPPARNGAWPGPPAAWPAARRRRVASGGCRSCSAQGPRPGSRAAASPHPPPGVCAARAAARSPLAASRKVRATALQATQPGRLLRTAAGRYRTPWGWRGCCSRYAPTTLGGPGRRLCSLRAGNRGSATGTQSNRRTWPTPRAARRPS